MKINEVASEPDSHSIKKKNKSNRLNEIAASDKNTNGYKSIEKNHKAEKGQNKTATNANIQKAVRE